MSDTKLHLCFECGTKNRVPDGLEGDAKCGSCGIKLYPSLPTTKKTAAQTNKSNNAPKNKPSSKQKSGLSGILLPMFVVAVVLGGGAILQNLNEDEFLNPSQNLPSPQTSSNRNDAATSSEPLPNRWAETAPPAPHLKPLPFRTGLLWNKTGNEAIAPFEIRSRSGNNYMLKFVDARDGRDAVAILVRGGETLEVEVPLGRYRLRYCAGETWFGEDGRFGPNEACTASDDLFHFRINGDYIEGHTVTLYTVFNGNMETRALDPDNF